MVDDLAAIEIKLHSASLNPGFPRVKLSPEASHVLSEGISGLENVGFIDDKHNFRITRGFPSSPAPIKRVYVVEAGDEIEIDRLTPQQSVIELVRYTLPTSMIHIDRSAHFARCVKLAELVEFYRLKRPLALHRLSEVSARLEAHMG
jgi:hypothetical protein